MNEEYVSSMFTTRERCYFRNLRKRQRNEIIKLFDGKKTNIHNDVPLRLQVLQCQLGEATKMKIFEDLRHIGNNDKYITWARKATQIPLDVVYVNSNGKTLGEKLACARTIMDTEITGHDVAKREVLKILCQLPENNDASYAIGIEGIPGCGKTHFVKNALAPALGRPYVHLPIGGATDPSFLLGSVFTYEGSKEGRLVGALIESKCCNPIIHIDEVDKIPNTEQGLAVEAVLIHLVDTTAPTLRDRYFHGIDLDFSKCTFVFTYNCADRVNPVLLDRIKRIQMMAPTLSQRKEIIQKHTVPRVCKKYGHCMTLSAGALDVIFKYTSKEEGMRNSEKHVEHVLSSANLCRVLGQGAETVGLHRKVKVFESPFVVAEKFAEEVLRSVKIDEQQSTPPPNMYI